MPIGDIATFAISGKGLAYSYPSPMDHTPRRDWNETSPPTISASGRGRCRAAGRVAHRVGASLSVAAGAHHRRLSAGGAADIVARLMGQWLSERLGQPFVIENRPGAGSNIGTEAVVRAPAGRLHAPAGRYSANAINATLYDKLNFNFIRDIAPVASIIREPIVMVVNPSVPAKTVPEFIAYAKANPGKINMASAGNGTASPCRRRAVQDDGRRRHGSCAVSRRRARADRSARRAGAGHVRLPCPRRSSTSGPASCARWR